MKKTVITTLIVLLTVTSYAGIYRNSEETTGQSGTLYGNTSANIERDSGAGGLFRAPADDPGGRPGNGGGIGQNAPLKDGLPVMIACCVVLAGVKIFKGKRRK